MTMLSDGMLLGAGEAGPNITFVASDTAQVTGAVFTVNKPAGVQVGDLLLLGVVSSAAMTANTTPAGWTLVSSDYAAGSGARHAFYSKVADGSEGSSLSVTGTNVAKNGFSLAYRGASVVGTAGAAARAGSTNTGTAASISPGAAGALIAVFTNDGGVRTASTPPAGMTSRAYQANVTSGSLAIYDLIPSGAGATGSKVMVWSASGGVMSILLQIN